jgi:succinylglutamate desuccinylase
MKIINYKPELGAIKTLCIITGVHGNEAFLFDELKEFLAKLDKRSIEIKLILANELAAEKNVRFIDHDLNRVFNLEKYLLGHEAKLAQKLLNIIEGDLILDLHTHGNKEKFCLVPEKNFNNLKTFIHILKSSHCIIVPETLTKKRSLIENFNNAISIEVGQHHSLEAIESAKETVIKAVEFLNNEIKETSNIKLLKAEKFIFNKTNKEVIVNKKIKNFIPIKKGQEISNNFYAEEDFIPALVSYQIKPDKKVLLKCKTEAGKNGKRI